MRLRKLALPLAVCSLALATACGGKGPKVRVHISDPKHGGMEYDTGSCHKDGFVMYRDTDKFNCMNPSDFGTLLTYCRMSRKTDGPAMGNEGPKVTVYVSDPERGGMEYHNPITGEDGFVTYAGTDKFACLTPEDTTTLLNYCRTRGQTD